MQKDQIIEELVKSYAAFINELSVMTEGEFDKALKGKWDASQHADHLNKSLLPLILALRLPSFLCKLLFGKSNRKSISYEELKVKYLGKIASGSKAVRPYVPSKFSFESKEQLSNKIKKNIDLLSVKLNKYEEFQLDEILLPHPILGKITLREMLYFTVYHAEHHRNLLLKNLEA